MDALNTFLNLLARTEGRDKALRLVQFACLHSLQHKTKGSTFKVYEQIRMVRKVLRFLRSLQYSSKIKQDFPKLINSLLFLPSLLKYLTGILQNLFNVLYYLSDHRVFLGEIGVIDKSHVAINLPRSMLFYLLQNIFGVLHNLVQIVVQIMKGAQKNGLQFNQKIKAFLFDLVRCLLDCFVALFYRNRKYTPKNIGIIGVISSLMAICQSLGYI